MSDSSNILDSFGGGVSDFFSNLFGGGSSDTSTPALAPAQSDASQGADASANLPTASTGGDSGFNLFTSPTSAASQASSIFGSNDGVTTSPVAAGAPTNIQSFLNDAQAPAGGGLSVTGAGDSGQTAGQWAQQYGAATPPPDNSPSTLSQIASALGLNNKDGSFDTGGLLKGLVGAGGLAYDAVKGSGNSSAEKAVKNEAANAGAQGTQLESYLANGTLPPGAQQYVNQQSAAQKASIMSKYAWMGMTGSTAEAQELANVDSQAQASMFQIATQLYNSGVNQTGASSQLYQTLMNAQNQDNTDIGNAIKNFVSALGGGTSSSQK